MITPILAPGEVMPTKPVYWLIWVLNQDTKKPYHSRACWDKTINPTAACQRVYGVNPTENMRFFNLTSRITDARKRLREIAQLWAIAVK